MNVHHKCQKKVANLCGVNQKLMAEALAIIDNKQQVRRRRKRARANVDASEADSQPKTAAVLPLVFRPDPPEKATALVERARWASASRESSELRPEQSQERRAPLLQPKVEA